MMKDYNMKILLVTMYYHPEPVAIPHDLAAALQQRGHEVTVVTGFPNYPSGEVYAGYRMRPWQWEKIDEVDVLRVPFFIDRSSSALRRIISFMSYTFMASVLALCLLKRPDVIWSYQLGLPGVFISVFKRAPLVHEVQDLWPEWGKTAEMGLRGWLYGLLDHQERFVYRYARAIITISNGFKRILIAKKVPDDKITLIPNWANEKNFRPIAQETELGEREGLVGRFNVMYVGNIGTAQALGVVLDAAEALRDKPAIQFVLYGAGIERENLLADVHKRQLSNVRLPGGRPQSEIARYIAFADALFIHLRNDPAYAITIPSKTYAYLASGRPILVAASGDVADLISSLEAGIVCPPEDSASLAQAVRQLYEMPALQREQLGHHGREAFMKRFNRHVLIDQYITLFEANRR